LDRVKEESSSLKELKDQRRPDGTLHSVKDGWGIIDCGDEPKVVGVAKLLADNDDTTTLIPPNTDRIKRRSDDTE